MEQRIGFGMRLGAILIDAVIIFVGGMIVGVVFGGLIGGVLGGVAGGADAAEGAAFGGVLGAMVGAALGIMIVGILYGLIEAFTGASPGKMILKIKIGNADGTAAPIGTLLGRYAIKNIALLCSLVAGVTGVTLVNSLGRLLGLVVFIGCFFVLGAAKQAFHDMIMKTAVYPKDALG